MGYRSDVSITMHKKDYRTMVEQAKNLQNEDVFETLQRGTVYENNDEVITIKFEWFKWYEEYEDIQWIMNFIQNIDCKFIRIGEENDDIEEITYGDDYALFSYTCVERNIYIDGKEIEENL